MRVAIYSRKSKLTERGESIQNQIDMCKNYVHMNFSTTENDLVIYEDEGYSGGTTDRPEFKRLLRDIAKKHFDAIICYRLDRISRNVLDFSSILETLNKYDTSFISVTEHFDTTTPMGRAMVNIAAVFAQLERETIAERIRDNMRRLARTGRYIGSTPPFGFKSEKIEYIDTHGNKKKMHKLAPVSEDIKFVKLIFEKYLELESLAKIETWLMQNGYKNRNGNYTGVSELRRLLTNPVYVKAHGAVYDYYTALGTEVVNQRDEFNDINGMLLYGRHDRNNSSYDPKKWLVVLAKHEGIIDAEKWLSIQHLLEQNKDKAPRAGTSKNALLTSKIKCQHCGGTMVVIYGQNKKKHYYKCRNKIKSRKGICDIKNIIGQAADEEVLNYLKGLSEDKEKTTELLKKQRHRVLANKDDLTQSELALKKSVQEKEAEIKNLIMQLRKNENSIVSKYIISDIESLDNELQTLKKSFASIEAQKDKITNFQIEEELSISAVWNFGKMSEEISFEERKMFIDKIVDKILWDGSSFAVLFR